MTKVSPAPGRLDGETFRHSRRNKDQRVAFFLESRELLVSWARATTRRVFKETQVLLFVARMLLKSTVLEVTVLAVVTLRIEHKKFFNVELDHVVLQ